MIVYGGASFDSSLIKAGLIDEFHLFVNPAAIGNGMTIFKDLNEMQKFTLVKSIAFDCGIVVLHYEPKESLTRKNNAGRKNFSTTVNEYLATLLNDVRKVLQKHRHSIKSIAPEA